MSSKDLGASLRDRATHEPSQQAVSAVPVSVPSVLHQLADRVELLSGPDREIDALIGAATNSDKTARVIFCKGNRRYLNPGAGRLAMHVGFGKGIKWGIAYQQKSYTADLNAAMTLCGPRPSFDLSHEHEQQGGLWICLVGDFDGWVVTGRASAATPALALTASALRALAKRADAPNPSSETNP